MSPIVSFMINYNGGNAALNSGDNDGAVRAYKKAVTVWEKTENTTIPSQMMAMCLTNLGIAYTRQGLVVEEIAVFDRSIEIHPSFLMALYNKARLLEKVGRIAEAIGTWGTYLKLARTHSREQDSIPKAERHLSLCKVESVLKKQGVPYIKTSDLMGSLESGGSSGSSEEEADSGA
jgi:tetratricopeptide (TPR) repeat protein